MALRDPHMPGGYPLSGPSFPGEGIETAQVPSMDQDSSQQNLPPSSRGAYNEIKDGTTPSPHGPDAAWRPDPGFGVEPQYWDQALHPEHQAYPPSMSPDLEFQQEAQAMDQGHQPSWPYYAYNSQQGAPPRPPPSPPTNQPPGLDERIQQNNPQMQLFTPVQPAVNQQNQNPSSNEQMQMMMMNQMMMQQMTAQQMQAAQLAAMSRSGSDRSYDPCLPGRGGQMTSINIQNCRRRRRLPGGRVTALHAQERMIAAAPTIRGGSNSSAFDNWQEATIILCVAIVGLVYLISARSSPDDEKKPSLAARHMS